MPTIPKLTVKDRMLLHLLPYSRELGKPSVPFALTQHGIAQAVIANRSHVSMALKDLREEELVLEEKAHVQGGGRRRLAYFLTEDGFLRARTLRHEVLAYTVLYKGSEVPIAEVMINEASVGVVEAITKVDDQGRFWDSPEGPTEADVREQVALAEAEMDKVVEEEEMVEGENPPPGPPAKVAGPAVPLAGPPVEVAPTLQAPGPPQSTSAMEEELPPVYGERARAGLAKVGLGLLLTASPLAGGFLPFGLCMIAVLPFLLGIGLVIMGMIQLRAAPKAFRRAAFLVSYIAVSAVLLFVHALRGERLEGADVEGFVIVSLSVFGVLAFVRKVPAERRAGAARTLGSFTVAVGFASIVLPVTTIPELWTLMGAYLWIAGRELSPVKKDEAARTMLAHLGLMASTAGALLLVLVELDTSWVVILAAWLALGFALMFLGLKRPDVLEGLTMAVVLMAMGGALFILVGIAFVLNTRYPEGVAEAGLGVLLGTYAANELRGHGKAALVAALMVVMVAVSVATALWIGV